MLISFTTPNQNTDGSAISPTAVMKYLVFLDTVNPPVKSYQVPDANVAAGVAQPDGTVRVAVDAVKDLKAALVVGTTYFVGVEDSENGVISAETPIVSVKYNPTPNPVGNFSAA